MDVPRNAAAHLYRPSDRILMSAGFRLSPSLDWPLSPSTGGWPAAFPAGRVSLLNGSEQPNAVATLYLLMSRFATESKRCRCLHRLSMT